jgi:hypothetical protein
MPIRPNAPYKRGPRKVSQPAHQLAEQRSTRWWVFSVRWRTFRMQDIFRLRHPQRSLPLSMPSHPRFARHRLSSAPYSPSLSAEIFLSCATIPRRAPSTSHIAEGEAGEACAHAPIHLARQHERGGLRSRCPRTRACYLLHFPTR